jgi:hypothetical protein
MAALPSESDTQQVVGIDGAHRDIRSADTTTAAA